MRNISTAMNTLKKVAAFEKPHFFSYLLNNQVINKPPIPEIR
jgi:hypothetical protein